MGKNRARTNPDALKIFCFENHMQSGSSFQVHLHICHLLTPPVLAKQCLNLKWVSELGGELRDKMTEAEMGKSYRQQLSVCFITWHF